MNLFETSILFRICIGLIIIIFSKIIGSLIAYILIKMFYFKEKNVSKIRANAFFKPIKYLLIILSIYLCTFLFVLPESIKLIIVKVFKICIILIIANGFSNLFNTNSDSFNKIKIKLNVNSSDTFINFVSKIFKFLVYIIAGFLVVSELGYNLGGLFTGLGISSVVIALAAQDLAKSLFGGLAILLDKPFNIGDYIVVNNNEGTVEDITFRTTRIRNLANELIIVPNSEIAGDYIINYNRRNSRQYELLLVLELSTSLNKIADFKQKLIQLLTSNQHILNKNMRIFFDTISDNGFNLNISFYTDIIKYNDFLQFKEDMNFTIMNLLQEENIELAYDSKTIYLQK